ncbi:iron-containing alcohol dehydrogenase [Spirochaeta africana]|uniref:iron-containing alcohol dehydrogenase n=1 Tax=Spirochaeta africana TaxID=46355 RepID=UPI0002471BA2|nr:iron-containing alcohol dehydrogenase [Spirochaeta africana]
MKTNTPQLWEGSAAVRTLAQHIRDRGLRMILIVTDAAQWAGDRLETLLSGLQEQGVTWQIYTGTGSEATTDNIEEAAELYGITGCEGIVTFGGTASIDCGKVTAAHLYRPATPLSRLKRIIRSCGRHIPLFEITSSVDNPSVLGSAAAVIDGKTGRRLVLHGPDLQADAVVCDPELQPARVG